jgi:dihydroorotase
MPANFQPNLTPPVTTTEMALAYKEKLEKLEPNVQFLMTLYLSPQLTVEEVAKAKAAGIVGAYIPSLSLINRSQILSKVSYCYCETNRIGA